MGEFTSDWEGTTRESSRAVCAFSPGHLLRLRPALTEYSRIWSLPLHRCYLPLFYATVHVHASLTNSHPCDSTGKMYKEYLSSGSPWKGSSSNQQHNKLHSLQAIPSLFLCTCSIFTPVNRFQHLYFQCSHLSIKHAALIRFTDCRSCWLCSRSSIPGAWSSF